MGKKKYYCDFCDRHFNDDKNTRSKHSNSLSHLNMKKEHYNMFRDPEVLLKEESVKKPCRKFHYEGFCPFSGSCTFSHYSKEDLNAIKEELLAKKKNLEVEESQRTVDNWLQKYFHSLETKTVKSRKLLWSCELPPTLLVNSAFLPPSMLPFHIKNFIDADLNSWG